MEIDQAEAELLLKRARADRDSATAEVARLEALKAQALGLDRFIEGLELMFPALASAHVLVPETTEPEPRVRSVDPVANRRRRLQTNGPRATEVALHILRENRNKWYTGRAMIDEFQSRGIHATETAIRLALKRAAEKGTAERQYADDGGHLFRIRQEDAGHQEVFTP